MEYIIEKYDSNISISSEHKGKEDRLGSQTSWAPIPGLNLTKLLTWIS